MTFAATATAGSVFRTVQDGNWSSPATWAGGLVPQTGSDISSNTTITINHVVNYNTGNPIKNRGTIRIQTPLDGGRAQLNVPTNINFENYASGKVYITNAAYTQYRFVNGGSFGTKNSGTFKNIGGYVEVRDSFVEVAQDWVSESGGNRLFIGGCLLTGQNFSATGSGTVDVLHDASLSIGWHGSGFVAQMR